MRREIHMTIKNLSLNKDKDFIFIMELNPERYNYIDNKRTILDRLTKQEYSEDSLYKEIVQRTMGFSFTYSSPQLNYDFDRARMDFAVKDISIDKEKRELIFKAELHPERYVWRESENEKNYVFDKIEKIEIPEDLFSNILKMAKEVPFSVLLSREIENDDDYIESRREIIEKNVKNDNFIIPTFEDKSEEYLESIEKDEMGFAIICLDIVGSTNLSFNLSPKIYSKVISLISYEISEVVPKFCGHVLKYTGDGFIAYFPEPSFVIKNDLAVDCSLTILKLIYRVVNPIFQNNGMPRIDIRIGIESGLANVEVIGSSDTKQQKDIIGKIVSMAAKIQSKANPGEICIGETAERSFYTNWRKICKQARNLKDWNYKNKDGSTYKIYRLKTSI